MQYITTTFCNPCDNNSNVTRTCSPLKCPLANMAPQYRVTSFDEDYDGVTYFIVGGNDNHGWPAFQVDNVTGLLSTATLIDYEVGPRSYNLQIALQDNGTKVPGPQRVIVTVTVTVVDVDDPPLLTSANVTSVVENTPIGNVVYTFQSFDADGDNVTCYIIGGNFNPTPPVGAPGPAFAVNASTCKMSPYTWLDYEAGPRLYNLLTILSDGKLNTTIVLTVHILSTWTPRVGVTYPHRKRRLKNGTMASV